MKSYDDIIHLPHPVSKKHLPMDMHDRAAQFSPFAALTGYEDALDETARWTEREKTLTEEEMQALNEKFRILEKHMKEEPEVIVTYFAPDLKKEGGIYNCVSGTVKKLDPYEKWILLADGTKIFMTDCVALESKSSSSLFGIEMRSRMTIV